MCVISQSRVAKFLSVLPGCSKAYIGKTERNLATRLSEHSDPLKSGISKHLTDCEHANFILDLNNLYDNLNNSDIHQPDTSFTDPGLLVRNTEKQLPRKTTAKCVNNVPS